MKDFNIAKYLKENYQGPFSMFQPYTDLNPLKEESEEQLDTEIPYKGPDPHLDGMGSDFEQAEPVEEGNLSEDATMTFDMNDPEASEDALEWILDNISDTEDVVRSEEEALQFRIGSIEDMVGTMNTRLRNATIEIKEDDIIDQLSQEYGEWLDQNNLPQISADELLYDNSIKKTPEQKRYLQDFIDKWNNSDQSITLTIRNTPRIKEEVGAEQEKYDRMMGLAHKYFEKISPIVRDTINNLRQDGFNDQDIIDFLATDFTITEDGANVTTADNEAYSAGMEEEVTVSSSGVEM